MSTEFFEEEAEVSDDDLNSSSDEEDEEGEDLDKNLDDLIDDEPVDDDDDGDDSSDSSDQDVRPGKKKRKRRHHELDDRLEDEDYDLIEENLGVKVDRKKFRRLKQLSSDESEKEEDAEEKVDDREVIASQLFEGAEEEEEREFSAAPPPHEEEKQFADIVDSESEEESDEDDFIVDDDGQPLRRKKDRRKPRYTDSALQEAQDIFGIDDFDFEEFEHFGDEYEDEDEYEDYEEEEEGEGESRPSKVKKRDKKKASKRTIYDVFEPSELERGHFTDLDKEIRTADVPERFKLRAIPVRLAADDELDEEADWVYKHAFLELPVTMQNVSDPLRSENSHVGTVCSSTLDSKGPSTVGKIREAINFIRNQQFEVPFIAFYRKEYIEPELNIYDLWKVYHWDEKWTQLRTRKRNLKRLFEKMQNYQFDLIPHDVDASLPENIRPLTETDMDRLDAVQTPEELRDVYMQFLLYYGRDIPKMQNAEKA